jgi:hypothetical protein
MTFAGLLVVGIVAAVGIVMLARYVDGRLWARSLVSYQLRLPATLETGDMVAWLSALAALTHAPRGALVPEPPVVVELVASASGVMHVVRVPERMRGALLASVRASLPGCRLDEMGTPSSERSRFVAAAEVWLAGKRRQLAVERTELVSRSLLAACQPLSGKEELRWQWIITGAGTPEPIRQDTTSDSGLPWWLEGSAPADSDELRAARLKQREPLLHVSGRLVVSADSREQAWSLFGKSWGAIRLLNVPGARLVRSLWLSRLVAIRGRRLSVPVLVWPLRLNAAELAGLLAFPLGEVPLPGLPVGITRQVPPPVELSSVGTVLSDSTYPGFDRPLAVSRKDRLLHVALLGPTGTGKSTVMINMALQDAIAGDGLAVLDPKADMAADLLTHLPLDRHGDVVIVNPADTARPVGFNVLATDGSETSRELAVDHVLHVFHEQWKEFWGPRTDAVLRAGLLTLTSTAAADGSAFTVCELPTLLTDTGFRRWVTSRPSVPPAVHEFWSWFEGLSSAERTQVVGPVINKLTALTQRTPLRLLLGQSEGIDLAAAMRNRKILFMPLSRGLVGSETAALLSSLMMASLWQATLGRVRTPAEQRRPFWLFVDEAAEVVRLPLDLADVMSEARGLGVGLTLATQYLAQLPPPVRKALLATVRSQVVFQVEVEDATLLARSFEPSLTADDLRALPAHEVAMRLAIQGQTSRPMTGKTRPLPEPTSDGNELRASSRERYGRARREVEAGLAARRQAPRSQAVRADFGKRPRQAGGRP